MREYKFRGKRVDNDEWVYGYGTIVGEHYGRMHGEEREASIFVEYDEASKLNFQLVEVDPKTVGQYTGLQDRNGVDIYEGDIYHQGDKNIRYIVVWKDTGLIGKQLGTNSYSGLQYWSDKIEVIGTRFDNPDLLGEVSK